MEDVGSDGGKRNAPPSSGWNLLLVLLFLKQQYLILWAKHLDNGLDRVQTPLGGNMGGAFIIIIVIKRQKTQTWGLVLSKLLL